jgi:hypothetical protein
MMRRTLLFLPLLVAGCGEPVADNHFARQPESNAAAPSAAPASPVAAVRVGELGPNFAACPSAGTSRHVAAGGQLAMRQAPFDNAAEAGGVPVGARFFVCTRSHDQKWLGIVVHDSGRLDQSCGVSAPLASRRAYDGPCRSGWVSSAFVRLVADASEDPAANQAGAGVAKATAT